MVFKISPLGGAKPLVAHSPSIILKCKACGPDMIPARILRDMAEEISPILTTLFQRTIDLGELPEDWKSANVSPIFKKGDRFKASNYRPV